jgi:hypothetical protein
LLIIKVAYDSQNTPLYLKYLNSTEYGGIKYGIREGVIHVKDPDGHILQQKWVDGEQGVNWTFNAANDYPKDTRVVRLRLLG